MADTFPHASKADVKRVIDAIRRKSPDTVSDLDDGSPNYGVLTTGSIAVDAVTVCGGFPRGRVTEVSGWEASGKTTLALMAAARAIRQGMFVAYIDQEQALDFDFAQNLGIDASDTSKMLYLTPPTFEASAQAIESVITENLADLIILDSVSAMVPDAVFKAEVGGTEGLALRARLMSSWMPRLINSAKSHERKPAVVLVNQLRSIIPANPWEGKFGPKTTTSGGAAVKFYSSLRLEMKQVRKGYLKRKAADPFRNGKEVEIPIANEHQVKVTKNKVGASYRDAPLWIRYDEVMPMWGIDNVMTLLDMASAAGHVSERKGFYTIGERKIHGAEAAHAVLAADPALCRDLAVALGLDWDNYAPLHDIAAPAADADEGE